jgi:hypothetical protein
LKCGTTTFFCRNVSCASAAYRTARSFEEGAAGAVVADSAAAGFSPAAGAAPAFASFAGVAASCCAITHGAVTAPTAHAEARSVTDKNFDLDISSLS